MREQRMASANTEPKHKAGIDGQPGSGWGDIAAHRRRARQMLDAYWRASNYLSVGQIYLLDNPLLQRAAEARAHQAAAARPLGHDARA